MPKAPSRWGLEPRITVLLSILVVGFWAALELELRLSDLVPSPGGREVVREFFSRALSPAWTYESETVAAGTPPLIFKALAAAHRTVVFAAAAMSLALVLGLPLGFLAATSWWKTDSLGQPPSEFPSHRLMRFGTSLLRPGLCALSRVLIVGLRSLHELLWAVLFLAAFGLSHLSAVVAIAIPFAGTLAKVFSEMLDETPRDAADALRHAGLSQPQVFLFALFPRALPDLGAYTFYRFECALRSAAILGFFGFPTLGYLIAASFENLYYGEVWTYLYTLGFLVFAADWWSGALRSRLVQS